MTPTPRGWLRRRDDRHRCYDWSPTAAASARGLILGSCPTRQYANPFGAPPLDSYRRRGLRS
jgi:hypothetical protein